MLLTSMLSINVLAAETTGIEQETSENGNARAGVETLPYGTYGIGPFTFIDNNLTPVKTVAGSTVSFRIVFQKASQDQGIGPVKLTVQIRDIYGNAISDKWVYPLSSDNEIKSITTPEINLGYTGRKIQIWFDASSVGASNGNYRSIYVSSFTAYVK